MGKYSKLAILKRYAYEMNKTTIAEYWEKLAGLRFKERVKLAWWLLIGQKDIKKGNKTNG
jgi:hypothetical protein